MTKHVHAEMIKAKADDEDLVLFIYSDNHKTWSECNEPQKLFIYQSVKFFLCLPQHKEACLHWLNGGVAEQWCNTIWLALDSYVEDPAWHKDGDFMDSEFKVRIRPRKQKRWITYGTNSEKLGVLTFKDKQKCIEQYGDEALNGPTQFIEIEVEI